MSIFDKTIDKDGPKECCRLDCDDARKETERYGVVLLMYSMDPTVNVAIQMHLSLQVCKSCQDKIKPDDLVTPDYKVFFKVATSSSGLPEWHPARVLNPERTKIAWRTLGKYEKPQFVDVGSSTPLGPH